VPNGKIFNNLAYMMAGITKSNNDYGNLKNS